jgi:hypothetical protein
MEIQQPKIKKEPKKKSRHKSPDGNIPAPPSMAFRPSPTSIKASSDKKHRPKHSLKSDDDNATHQHSRRPPEHRKKGPKDVHTELRKEKKPHIDFSSSTRKEAEKIDTIMNEQKANELKKKKRQQMETEHMQEVTKLRKEREKEELLKEEKSRSDYQRRKKKSENLLLNISNKDSNYSIQELEQTDCVEEFKHLKKMFLDMRKARKAEDEQLQKGFSDLSTKIMKRPTRGHRQGVKPLEAVKATPQKPSMSVEKIESTLSRLLAMWNANDKIGARNLAKQVLQSIGPFVIHDSQIDYSTLTVDEVTKKIIQDNVQDLRTFTPLETTGYGSCLFNAISLVLVGHEGLGRELRLRTALYLLLNESVMQEMHKNASWGPTCDPNYDNEVKKCLQLEGYSTCLQMEGCGRATDLQITSMFPFIENSTDFYDYIDLSTTLNKHCKHMKKRVLIMWTSVSDIGPNFKINHFVPLIPQREMLAKQKEVINLIDTSRKVQKIKSVSFSQDDDSNGATSVKSSESKSSSSSISKSHEGPFDSSPQPKSPGKIAYSPQSKSSLGIPSSPLAKSSPLPKNMSAAKEDEAEIDKTNKSMLESSNGSTAMYLKSHIYLPTNKSVSIAKRRKPIARLPLGPKGGKVFVVKNDRNFGIFKAKYRIPKVKGKRKLGPKMTYVDDCGQYKKPSQKEFVHEVDPETGELVLLRRVQLDNDVCTLDDVALEVQPNINNLLLTKCTYQKSKISEFEKKTTEFMVVPEKLKDIIGLSVVEYKGQDPPHEPHGNATKVCKIYWCIAANFKLGCDYFY